ncbi:MAG: DUF4249 domain-containing protein [Bacteroidales bacterium]|nr:DUF4249 domain-containing protein [Bacteroidales bacterium]
MLRIKNILLILTMLALSACIKSFDPVIDASAENKYVVSGRVTDAEGWQEVEVSLTSPIGSPKFIPVTGCQVSILDDKGNDFTLNEWEPGKYQVWMGHEYLIPGTSYQVKVTTPGGEELVSGFDKMSKGPPLDSVYYSINDIPTADPTINLNVMQFYVDLQAEGDYSHFYKWDVVETWEYHAALPAEYYFDGSHHKIVPPDYTNKVCWTTGLAKNVFTISTKSLAQNKYEKYPLHSIDGRSSRLGILYSMLVRQLSISEEAYNYWEKLRINSNEQGGLYEKQPLAIKGNMMNLSKPEKDVLGFFYAASERSHRYFYQNVEGIELKFSNFCFESGLGRLGWKEFFWWEYPVYYYFNEVGALRILSYECIDCRKIGGTIVKPDFWPR